MPRTNRRRVIDVRLGQTILRSTHAATRHLLDDLAIRLLGAERIIGQYQTNATIMRGQITLLTGSAVEAEKKTAHWIAQKRACIDLLQRSATKHEVQHRQIVRLQDEVDSLRAESVTSYDEIERLRSQIDELQVERDIQDAGIDELHDQHHLLRCAALASPAPVASNGKRTGGDHRSTLDQETLEALNELIRRMALLTEMAGKRIKHQKQDRNEALSVDGEKDTVESPDSDHPDDSSNEVMEAIDVVNARVDRVVEMIVQRESDLAGHSGNDVDVYIAAGR